jgi:lipopolysaccharide/colanic/teichoic acid biosynthesis glycosyltransferase/GT2 family glycosyltransferase
MAIHDMSRQRPTLSVIIPTFNSQDALSSCLQALENQSLKRGEYEVIVVDDGSKDQTAEVVLSFPGARLVSIQHSGPSVARNYGAKAAVGDLIAFTDSDCVPVPAWLEEISAPFDDPHIVGVKGTYRSTQKGIVPRFVQLEYQHKYKRMARQHYIDFIDTYAAAYRKTVFLSNGGFDPSFTVPSVEDQELSFRLAQKGYRMVFAQDATVVHQHDKNLIEYWSRKFGIGYWKAYMLRWMPQKMFADSHTPASQRLQILFLGLAFLSALVGVIAHWSFWLAVGWIVLFFLTAVPFWSYIAGEDVVVSILAPFLLLIRAAALGTGLLIGFLSPPRRGSHDLPSLPIGTYIAKRMIDIIISSVGLIVFSPLILLAGICIKFDSPGPMFFIQPRAGENGKPFRMVKLRTMVQDADKQLADLFLSNPLKGPVYKIPNDPRITRVGRFLRRWSIDEIPQFWNVFKGEMSLVGPRPEEIWLVEKYTDLQRKRLAFKPGMTGPMQINGRGELDFEQRFQLEMDYIQRYSLLNDIRIMSQSLPAIIKGTGAF